MVITTLTGATFTGNIANSRSSAVDINGGEKGTTTISGCTFSENDDTKTDSTIQIRVNCHVELSDCTFSGNKDGGKDAIYFHNASATLGISGKITDVNLTNVSTEQIVVNGVIDESIITVLGKEATYTEGAKILVEGETADSGQLALAANIIKVATDANGGEWFIAQDGTLAKSTTVAQVGSTYYTDVVSAVNAAVASEEAEVIIYVYQSDELGVTEAISIASGKTLTITNASGKDVELTRTEETTLFNVAEGGVLTIGSDASGSITLDGGYDVSEDTGIVTAEKSIVENSGKFTLGANATLTGGNAGTAKADENIGGALFNAAGAEATLYGNVSKNTAYRGGAVYNRGTLTIKGGTYENNESPNNGAVFFNNGGTLTIEAGTFQNNTGGKAGAVVYSNNLNKVGTLNVSGGTFSSNTIEDGNGCVIYCSNSTFTDNIAEGRSGAIDVNGGDSESVVVTDCTFSGNNSSNGATIAIAGGKTLNISDSTFSGTEEETAATIHMRTNAASAVLSGKVTGVTFTNSGDGDLATILVGGYISEDSDISITPYEYVEGEFVLGACENVSPKTLELATEILDVTQVSGNYWFMNSTGYLSQVVAKINGTEGSYADVLEAIANTSSAVEIQFLRDVEISETIEIPTGANVSITNATGANVTLIRTGVFDVFNVATDATLTIGSADATKTITIDGANIESAADSLVENSGTFNLLANAILTGGNAGTSNDGSYRGGALHNASDATATLYGTVTGNIAYNGGAIYNQGTLIIEDGTYTDNTAQNGGGVIYGSGTITINDGIFHDNATEAATAGVVYCSGTLNINGGTFYKNSAKTGGGVVNVAGTATIKNATMYENSLTGSTNAGGAIYASKGKTITLENCTIYSNSLDYKSNTNSGCDVSLGANVILNLKNNQNIGIVQQRHTDKVATINILEEYTGLAVLIPYNDTYTIGSPLVYFNSMMTAEAKANTVEKLVVRDVVSETEFDDVTYCVDEAGLLQYKGAEAKIGTITYPMLAEAVTAANSGETVYVLKDIELSETIAIGDSETAKEITIANVSGKDIQLTRTNSVSMFTVASGSTLTIGSADTANKLILDGGYVSNAETPLTGETLVNNAGTFELSANATLQNASTGGAANGGALYNTGTARLYGNMTGNTANEGGAIKNAAGSVTIHSGTYSGNVSSGGAGGFIHSGTTGNEVTINGGYFYGNEAQSGTAGVIYCNGTLTINGGEYYNNKAVSGGGVVNVAGTATITNAIMHDNSLTNSSNAGGAIYVSKGKTVTLEECAIYSNATAYKSNANPGCDISLGANVTLNLKNNTNIGIIQQRYTNAVATINVLEECTTPIIFIPYNNAPVVDAQLVYFDSTMIAEAKATSAGNITVRKCASETEYNDDTYYVDSDGYVRITSDVAKVGDLPYETLEAAIAAVETSDATTIYVLRDSDISETIDVGTADAAKNITIANAPGVDVTLTRTSATEMFTVASGSNLAIGSESTANAIAIDGGYVADAEEPLTGSSLINNAGTFTLNANATLQNANAGTNNGGALYTTGDVYIYGTVKDNSAKNGGAIYVDDGSLEATGATFSGNTASGNGGALNGAYDTATIKLDACTLKENESTSSGGAIYSRYKLEVYNNCSFIDNVSNSSGGAISVYNRNNTDTITIIKNSSFTGNTSVSRASALDINGTNGEVTVSGCRFSGNSDTGEKNSTIQIQADCNPVLSDCTFEGNKEGGLDELYMYNGSATLSISGKITGIKVTNLLASQLIVSGAIDENSDITVAGRSATYAEGTVILAQGESVTSEQLAQAATIIKVAPNSAGEWTIASDGTLTQVVTE